MRVRRYLQARGSWILSLVVAAVLAVGWTPALTAQTAEDEGLAAEDLRSRLEERFEILPLRSGLLLRSLGDEGPALIEIGDEIVVDGTAVDEDELAARLGSEGALLVLAAAAGGLDSGAEADAAPEEGAEAEESAEDEASPDADVESSETVDETVVPDRSDRDERHRRRVRRDTQIVIGSSLTIEADEITDDVMVMGGPLRVEGRVEGDAVAVGAPVTVIGHVEGDVASIGSSVRLRETARVDGDVVSVGSVVERDPGSYVGGEVEDVPFSPRFTFGDWGDWWRPGHIEAAELGLAPWMHWMRIGWKVFWVLVVALFACLALMAARRPVERMERRLAAQPWKCGLVGLAAQILALPVLTLLCVVLGVSIIGIPVLLLLPFALIAVFVASFFGFVAVARRLGLWVAGRFGWQQESPYVQVVTGLGVIYVLALVGRLIDFGPFPLRILAAMFLFCGFLLWYSAVTAGFGAAILTRLGTADDWQRRSLPPVPPVPPIGEPESSWSEEEEFEDYSGPDDDSEPGSERA